MYQMKQVNQKTIAGLHGGVGGEGVFNRSEAGCDRRLSARLRPILRNGTAER